MQYRVHVINLPAVHNTTVACTLYVDLYIVYTTTGGLVCNVENYATYAYNHRLIILLNYGTMMSFKLTLS